jgi:aerobic-type carbon monoxide dehydrogenase small subunit (CoxS/CutS family)
VERTTDNRSTYQCPYCSTMFERFEILREHVLEIHRGQPAPEDEGTIRLTVNGEMHELRVEPAWTLYDVIHDKLGLTGAKQMCDRGMCGSCTVIVDGRAILSCMTLAVECDGKAVETIEGIAAQRHPLIEEYVEHHCMQCGYCTPGFIVSAKSLLDRNDDPTEQEIREALAGNLCRCGTYPQHVKAVENAAARLRRARTIGTGNESSRGSK